MDADEVWPAEWLRGVLSLAVLRAIGSGSTYGYAIAERLRESGLGVVKGGTLYPLLGRLENSGLLAAEWRAGDGGPGRKHYRLTPEGERVLEERTARWADFSARVGAHLRVPDAPGVDADAPGLDVNASGLDVNASEPDVTNDRRGSET